MSLNFLKTYEERRKAAFQAGLSSGSKRSFMEEIRDGSG